jgi:hypothetical protein
LKKIPDAIHAIEKSAAIKGVTIATLLYPLLAKLVALGIALF